VEYLSEGAFDHSHLIGSRRVLNATKDTQTLGGLQWQLSLTLLFVWVIVFCSLYRGVRSAGKVANSVRFLFSSSLNISSQVVYLTALAPYVLLLVLLVRMATLPGAKDGVVFYLKPEWKNLRRAQVSLPDNPRNAKTMTDRCRCGRTQQRRCSSR
jgi:solute carrier family 6 amino acid transporter-like protein 5/7/9/14